MTNKKMTRESYEKAFEIRLEATRRRRSGTVSHRFIADAAIYVRDTLEIALLAAQSMTDTPVTLDHAIAIYRLIDAERQRRDSEPSGSTGTL